MRKTERKSNSSAPSSFIISMLVLFFLANMVINPSKFIQQALDGISAWAFAVLPSVLPFMFFTKILSSFDTLPKLTAPLGHFSKKTFGTPPISIYAFLMAVLSGYPVGSRLVADLYLQGQISREDAFKMTSFCSTSGPMFIIGAVGVRMFHSPKIGYILFVSHIIGALVNGLLFKKLKIKTSQGEDFTPKLKSNLNNPRLDLSEVITNSVLSILSVGCIITIFFIVIECFSPIFSFLPANFIGLFEGIIEITKGCLSLSNVSNKLLSTVLCSFVISFGGISTILQSATMLSKLKMPIKLLIFQKLSHGFLSATITLLILLI